MTVTEVFYCTDNGKNVYFVIFSYCLHEKGWDQYSGKEKNTH